jgi:DNA adenine methylase
MRVNPSNTSGHTIHAKAPGPFLKWAGGKRRLAHLLVTAFPEDFDPKSSRFFEPFLGGGALTFALGNRQSDLYIPGRNLRLNDTNPDLVNAYKVIRDDVGSLISELKKFQKLNNAESFYEIRATSYTDEIQQAARFIYLNKTCFNGLWRVNSKGEFNVPFGRYANPNILDILNLELCSDRLQKAKISNSCFAKAVSKASEGDVVYFDPPYIPLTKTAAFSQYAKEDFGIKDQELLAHTVGELTSKGVRVLLSNSDTPLTRQIFGKQLKLRQVLVARTISAKASTRKSVYEVIGTNYRLPKDVDLQLLKTLN